jgi:hypothetical protein
MPAANLKIPAVDGPLTVDGKVDEPLWREARSFSLNSPDFGAAFPAGGDARIALCGRHLCLAARLPEGDRIVAMSQGRSPSWLREDQVVWTLAVHVNKRNRRLSLTVNPLGAYSLESTVSDPGVMDGVMAAAHSGAGEWVMEAAIPLSKVADIGFVSVERVRVPRPDAPELRWYWPGSNERMDFELVANTPNRAPEPELRPVRLPAPQQERRRSVTGFAAELAAHTGRTWSDEERARFANALETNVRKRMTEAALAERREWQKVATVRDWERFRDQRISALRKSFGPFPERTPLRAAVTRRADSGHGFVLENVVYESRPGRLVPANLYLPSAISGSIPAVVVVHSHHAPKTQSELQDMGMTWARSGVAVLVPDQPGAGERVESQAWPRESYYSRYALGTHLYLAGESLMKWMVWDLMRGIDMLLERPYIDSKRIVMLGAVAGGGDPAAVTAALDRESPSASHSTSVRPALRNTIPRAPAHTISKPRTRVGATGNRHGICTGAPPTSSSHGLSARQLRRGRSFFLSKSDGRRPSRRNLPGLATRRFSNSTAGAITWPRWTASGRFPVPVSART